MKELNYSNSTAEGNQSEKKEKVVREKTADQEGDLEAGEALDPEVEGKEEAEGHLEDHSEEIGVAPEQVVSEETEDQEVVTEETEDQEVVSVVETDPDPKTEADLTALMNLDQD